MKIGRCLITYIMRNNLDRIGTYYPPLRLNYIAVPLLENIFLFRFFSCSSRILLTLTLLYIVYYVLYFIVYCTRAIHIHENIRRKYNKNPYNIILLYT